MSITRRMALMGIAAAPAVALGSADGETRTGVAADLPATSLSPQEVTDRIEGLAFELAELLDNYRDGTSYAEIYPSGRFKNPVVIRRNTVSLPHGIRVS